MTDRAHSSDEPAHNEPCPKEDAFLGAPVLTPDELAIEASDQGEHFTVNVLGPNGWDGWYMWASGSRLASIVAWLGANRRDWTVEARAARSAIRYRFRPRGANPYSATRSP